MKQRVFTLALLSAFYVELVGLLLFVIVSLTGCSSTKYVADYDAETHSFLLNSQQKVDQYLTSKQAGAPFSSIFYSDIAPQFDSGILHAQSLERDSLTVYILRDLRSQVFAMKRLDSLGLASRKFYEWVKTTVDADFEAALAFEVEKKRGEK